MDHQVLGVQVVQAARRLVMVRVTARVRVRLGYSNPHLTLTLTLTLASPARRDGRHRVRPAGRAA